MRVSAETADPEDITWDGHRWTRLRSAMAGLASLLARFQRSVKHPMPGDLTLSGLLESTDRAPYYGFGKTQLKEARQAIEGVLELAPDNGSQLGLSKTERTR